MAEREVNETTGISSGGGIMKYSGDDINEMRHEQLPTSISEPSSIIELTELSFSNLPDKTDESEIPRISYLKLFLSFLWFGARSWGGPVTNLQRLQDEYVLEKKWMSLEKFNRVLAIYQVLPGPEVSELCCYLGLLAKGRLGAIIAGLGFLLPGFLLMFLFSFIYVNFNSELMDNRRFMATFLCLQPTVVAMIVKATHMIGMRALTVPTLGGFNAYLLFITLFSSLLTVLEVSFVLVLLLCGVLNFSFERHKDGIIWYIASALILIVGIILCAIVITMQHDVMEGYDLIAFIFTRRHLGTIFLLGLLAGLLTFGGAYTVIPFISLYAVDVGGWLTAEQFLAGIAFGSILPCPLSIVTTFVGYVAGGPGGAILMTIGMFAPAFSFTIIGHRFFEAITENKRCTAFLDGVTAGVIGLIAFSAIDLLRRTLNSQPNPGIGACVFGLALAALYYFKNDKGPLIIYAAALGGQVLYQ